MAKCSPLRGGASTGVISQPLCPTQGMGHFCQLLGEGRVGHLYHVPTVGYQTRLEKNSLHTERAERD